MKDNAVQPRQPVLLGRLVDELVQVGMELAECQDMRQETILLERAAELKGSMIRLWTGADKAEVVYRL
jgi:hypothetical protein